VIEAVFDAQQLQGFVKIGCAFGDTGQGLGKGDVIAGPSRPETRRGPRRGPRRARHAPPLRRRGMFFKVFQRVHVAAGESRVVLFQVHRAELRGDSISVGGGQPDGASLSATLPK
jgi:hypothetical protein